MDDQLPVVVNATLNPLQPGGGVRAEAPAGSTVAEVLGAAAPQFVAWVDGEPLTRDQWGTTVLREGQVLDVYLVTGHGKFFSAILSIGIMAATAAISSGALAGIGLASGSFGATLASAGVGLLGRLLSAALVPPPAVRGGDLEEFRRHPGIGPTANELRPYGVVPVLYGRRRHYPPQAARPYTEIVGNDQYVRMLFALGVGQYLTEDEKIGDTMLTEYDYEIAYGDGATPPALFSQDVQETTIGTVLYATAGSGTLQDASDLHEATRTTAQDADEISMDLECSEGMYAVSDSTGDSLWAYARLKIEYSPTGMNTWTNVLVAPGFQRSGDVYIPGQNVQGVGDIPVVPANTMYIAARKRETLRIGFRWTVTRGQYDVRVQYEWYEEDTGTNTQKAKPVVYRALRAVRHQVPVALPGVLLCALRIRATDSISSGLDKFNLIQTRKLPIWNGSVWTAVATTRSPAWAYADVLARSPGNARPVPLLRLLTAQLLAWDVQCTALGVTYDDIIDQPTTVLEAARAVAAVGLAAWSILDGKYGVVREVAQTVPRQMFTPRNSKDFEFSRKFDKRPHGLQVRFVNEEAEYEEDERLVFDDGYTVANATRYEVLETRGVTKPGHAYILGRYHFAQLRLRPQEYTLVTDVENLRCTRGDMVRVAHDVPLWGMGWGRIKSVGGGQAGLDDVVVEAPGGVYTLRVRHTVDGTQDTYTVVQDVVGETSLVTLTSTTGIAVGDMWVFGAVGLETVELVVTQIEPAADLAAMLTLVDAAPTILNALTGTIPTFQTGITRPADPDRITPPKPTIVGLRSDESVIYQDAGGAWKESAVLTFTFPVRVGLHHVVVEGRFAPLTSPNAWTYGAPAVPVDAAFIRFYDVEGGLTYLFQVRARNVVTGLSSAWTASYQHTVIGLSTPPADVNFLRLEGTKARWSYPTPPVDFSGFVVATHAGVNTHWASATPAHDGLITSNEFDLGALATGVRTVMVKAYDIAANESVNAAVLVLNLGDPIEQNVVVLEDFAAASFPGTLTGGAEVGPTLVANNITFFWNAVSTARFWDPIGSAVFWPVTIYDTMVYQFSYTPGVEWAPDARLLLLTTVAASSWVLEYRTTQGFVFWGADGVLFWGADAALFWGAEGSLTAWVAWPGELLNVRRQLYEFRLTTAGGEVQGVVTELVVVLDLPDVLEKIDDLVVLAAGTRLPLTKIYRVVKNVQLTVQDDGGTGVTAKTLDKNPGLGPLVKVYDAAVVAVNGLVDATVQGY